MELASTTDGRVIPIPPRGAGSPTQLTSGMSEVLSTLAAHELSRYFADPATRREQQPKLLRAAAQRLEEMARQAALAPPAAEPEAAAVSTRRATRELKGKRK